MDHPHKCRHHKGHSFRYVDPNGALLCKVCKQLLGPSEVQRLQSIEDCAHKEYDKLLELNNELKKTAGCNVQQAAQTISFLEKSISRIQIDNRFLDKIKNIVATMVQEDLKRQMLVISELRDLLKADTIFSIQAKIERQRAKLDSYFSHDNYLRVLDRSSKTCKIARELSQVTKALDTIKTVTESKDFKLSKLGLTTTDLNAHYQKALEDEIVSRIFNNQNVVQNAMTLQHHPKTAPLVPPVPEQHPETIVVPDVITIPETSSKAAISIPNAKTEGQAGTPIKMRKIETPVEEAKQETKSSPLNLNKSLHTHKKHHKTEAHTLHSQVTRRVTEILNSPLYWEDKTTGILNLVNSEKNMTKLEFKDVDITFIRRGNDFAVANVLSNLNSLHKLKFTNLTCDKTSMANVLTPLCDILTLQKLSFANLGLYSFKEIGAFLKRSGSLQVLSLTNCDLGFVKGTGELAALLEEAHSVVKLKLNSCGLGDNEVLTIKGTVERNSTLRQLSLNGNQITAKGLETILSAMKLNRTLKKLSLRGCGIHQGSISQEAVGFIQGRGTPLFLHID